MNPAHTLSIALLLAASFASVAWGAGDRRPAVDRLLNTLEPGADPAAAKTAKVRAPEEDPAVTLLGDGSVRHLRAPARRAFRTDPALRGDPVAAVRRFLKDHGAALHATGSGVDYEITSDRFQAGRRYLRLQQMSGGLPVFAGQAVVQLNDQGGVEYVGNYLECDSETLATLGTNAQPTVPPSEARRLALDHFQPQAGGRALEVSDPRLLWFAPSLLGLPGAPRLAWQMTVRTEDCGEVNDRVFLGAHTGTLLGQLPLGCQAQFRTVFDADNNVAWPPDFPAPPPVPRRIESGPASTVADVNQVYDAVGETYAFYRDQHGRHGIGGGDQPIFAVVRVCVEGSACPWGNAAWSGLPDPPITAIRGFGINEGIMAFGQGYVADDVVAHEYTHGVTQFESGLIYLNASGAINEAFSDIWGEFVDFANGRGNDSTAVRWDHGEDLPSGKNRNMKNPPEKGNPDRLGSDLFSYPTHIASAATDWGGVHNNSGIINKLAYLLTDGDTFNGYTITGLGVDAVAQLFYEANSNLLGPSADYTDLAVALHQAAANLAWSASAVANLHRACLAVEIVGNYVNAGNFLSAPNGCLRAGVSRGGPFPKVAQAVTALRAGDPLFVSGGNYKEQLRITKPMRVSSYGGTAVIGK